MWLLEYSPSVVHSGVVRFLDVIGDLRASSCHSNVENAWQFLLEMFIQEVTPTNAREVEKEGWAYCL
jgi:hypothetical protein